MTENLNWGEYSYLTDEISNAQAATVKITRSTAVMISDQYALTAAHSPLDANNEITPNLEVKNIWGEVRDITDVFYDVSADFAIVKLDTPFENNYSVRIADNEAEVDDAVFIVGHPKSVTAGGLGWATAFGTAYDVDHENGYMTHYDLDVIGGFSGSGIYNTQGELISILSGQNTRFLTDADNIYFDENLPIYNEIWDELSGWSAVGVKLDFIKPFLENHSVTNVVKLGATLPINAEDPTKTPFVDSVSLAQIETSSHASRLSTVAIAANIVESVNDFKPNGTGVIISDNLILTNAHVVEGKSDLTIGFANGELNSEVIILDVYPTRDLALIKLSEHIPEGYFPADIASHEILENDPSYVIGHPGVLWDSSGGWVVSAAVGEGVDKGDLNLIGKVSSGNSGGPIFNTNGELAGIVWGGGTGYADDSNDRQDPHTTNFAPDVQPRKTNVIGVDLPIIKEFVSKYLTDNAYQSGNFNYALDSIVDATGNIVVAGFSRNEIDTDLLIKYFDSSDLNEMAYVTPSGLETANKNEIIQNIAIQTDGKLLFIGSSISSKDSAIEIIRLNSDGSIDNGFGLNGKVSINNENYWETGNDIVALDSGNILLAGTQNTGSQANFFISQLDPNGVIDTTFGDNGSVVVDFGNSSDFAKSMIVQDDGSIIVVGFSDYGDGPASQKTNNFAMVRILKDGSLDESFGEAGYVITDFGDSDYANDVALQSDGKLLIAGYSYLIPEGFEVDFPAMLIARYNTDGTLDNTFGDEGYAFHNTSLRHEHGKSLTLTSEGQILLAGDVYVGAKDGGSDLSINGDYDMGVIRLNSDGTIDNTFSGDGLVTIDANGNESVENIFISNNQIILTGFSDKSNSVEPVVISLDLSGESINNGDKYEISDRYDAYNVVNANNEAHYYVFLNGVPVAGNTLRGGFNFDSSSDLKSINYQWLLDDVIIEGATTKTYDVTSADIGKNITFTSTYVDANDNSYELISRSVEIVEDYTAPPSDINEIVFEIDYDPEQEAPVLNSSFAFNTSISEVRLSFMNRSSDFSYEWSRNLDYNVDNGRFEITENLNSYLNSGIYKISSVVLNDAQGNGITVSPEQLQILGYDIQTSLYNPKGDSQAPQLIDASLGAVTIDPSSGEIIIPISGLATDYGGSGFQPDNIRTFINTPNAEDYRDGDYETILENGSFSGDITLSKFTPNGVYSISHIDLTDKAGNWKKHNVSDVSVNLVNPNSDSVKPSVESINMHAVYDTATNRPKIIIEGLVIDELAGFKEAMIAFDGPQNASYISLGREHDSDPSLNFKIELNLLNEYTPGTYTIDRMYIYDNAYNRITHEDIDFDLLNSSSQINVYFPTSDEMTQVDGSQADDFVFGSNNTDDTLEAGAGDDYLFAGEGDDIVNGGDGDDLIIGGNGAGDDYYKGGDGIDTVKYTSATDGITVNLSTGIATSTNGSDAAGIGTDTLAGIENIIGGNFDDILTGSSGANIIQGVAGSDLIDGVAGENLIDAGDGNDTITLTGNTNHDGKFAHNVSSSSQVATDVRINLSGKVKLETVVDGGADADIVNLSSSGDAFFLHDSFSGFHSSLTLTTDTHTGAQSTQRIMNVETINGLDGDDIIDLTSPDYSLAGQVITIDGGKGNDVIWGSDATETLIGGDGNDIIFGGSGNDTLTGGSGADTFEFTVSAGSDTITDYSKSDGDILKFYKRGEYEGDKEAIISAGVVTFGSVTIDLGDTSLNSLDALNVEYGII